MNHNIIRLFEAYLIGELEEREQKELMNWVNEQEENRLFFQRFCSDRGFRQRWESRKKISPEAAIRIFDKRTGKVVKKIHWTKYWTYAATILLILTIGGVYWIRSERIGHIPENDSGVIVPGSAKALLVLAGGKQISLAERDSLQIQIDKGIQAANKNSCLVYDSGGVQIAAYNELIIPRGGEYRVVLSDGTVVHLNSASSLKYPVVFDQEKREVILMGEGYFEVAKNERPFYVHVADMTVKVYGTVFNINSHQNRIRTALVEGKVGIQLKDEDKEYILQPSQLAEFDLHSRQVDIRETDLTPYLAWTKGLLVFNNETLEQILYTLSLWYDMEVFYQNPEVKNLHFTGCVKRYDRIDIILNALSRSVGVKFVQQGKALIVSKKNDRF